MSLPLPANHSAVTPFTLHKPTPATATHQAGLSDNIEYGIKGLDTLAADIAHIKENPAAAAKMDAPTFFKHAGAGAVGASPAIIASGLAAWKSWTADTKLNKADAALHQAGKLAAGVKIPTWLKLATVGTLVTSVFGLVVGASKNAGHKAAQRII